MRPDATVDLCGMSGADAPHRFWTELGFTAWADGHTVSMREAVHKVGHGSTTGAKLLASGVLPTVSAVGYQNPRVSRATVEYLTDLPSVHPTEVRDAGRVLVVRCGGPQRSGTPEEPWEPETGRSYYGFHRTMSLRQAVHATAAWWSVPPRTLGLPGATLEPGSRLDVELDRLWVTVGGLIVLDARIEHCEVASGSAEGYVRPLVGFRLADTPDERTGAWLPPTRSGNVALRLADW